MLLKAAMLALEYELSVSPLIAIVAVAAAAAAVVELMEWQLKETGTPQFEPVRLVKPKRREMVFSRSTGVLAPLNYFASGHDSFHASIVMVT